MNVHVDLHLKDIEAYGLLAKNIRNKLQKYIVHDGIKSLVVGVSGGIDSALCMALARPVCDELNIPLIGRSIPIQTNKQDEMERAYKVGVHFCTDFQEFDFGGVFQTVRDELIQDTDDSVPIRQGNVKARLRMIILYDLASKNKGMVLSTDNYTELLLGFWTLHGDVGDYGMVQNLWKAEVYELAKYIQFCELPAHVDTGFQDCIDAVPTDGLGITNSDLDQLGVDTYAEADRLLKQMIKTGENTNVITQRCAATAFKRGNPYNISRKALLRDDTCPA